MVISKKELKNYIQLVSPGKSHWNVQKTNRRSLTKFRNHADRGWDSMMTMMNLKNLLELPMQVQMQNTIYCIVVSSLLCSPSVDNPSACEKSSDLPASIIL